MSTRAIDYWPEAIAYLGAQDSVLARLIVAYPEAGLVSYHNAFYTLSRAIVGQQISVKAADTIWLRLESLLSAFSAQDFLALTSEELRACGLSGQKIDYITHLARALVEGKINPHDWLTMDDAAIIKELTALRGIGLWTAQMFLIFHLHRPDVLPLADLGLINAINIHYADVGKLSREEIVNLAEGWKPYRTVAT